MEEREMNQEMLAKKDIEIELLNGSLANLNLKVTDITHVYLWLYFSFLVFTFALLLSFCLN